MPSVLGGLLAGLRRRGLRCFASDFDDADSFVLCCRLPLTKEAAEWLNGVLEVLATAETVDMDDRCLAKDFVWQFLDGHLQHDSFSLDSRLQSSVLCYGLRLTAAWHWL